MREERTEAAGLGCLPGGANQVRGGGELTDESLARSVVDCLTGRGLNEVEVYLKSGRSRRFEIGPQGRVASSSQEEGWAVAPSFLIVQTPEPN